MAGVRKKKKTADEKHWRINRNVAISVSMASISISIMKMAKANQRKWPAYQ
jgi:hypothetical protein